MSTTPLADTAAAATGTLPEPCVLLKLGEVVLKGGNRYQFERMLQANIRRAIADVAGQVRLWQRDGVIVIRVAPDSEAAPALTADRIAERARDVMGIARVCRAVRVAKDPDAAIDAAVALMAGKEGSFAVRPAAATSGSRVTSASSPPGSAPGSAGVRLPGQPEASGHGPVRRGRPARGVRLHRGLPRAGRAAGRDERPGACPHVRRDRLTGRRLPDDAPRPALRFPALLRYAADRARVGVQGLRADAPAGPLSGGSRLFVVAFGKAQQRLASSGASRLQIVAQRRLMLKTGEVLAGRLGAAALVTGDSLGQVSSQTLTNLAALDDAVGLPILRPLIGCDKLEIMAEARRIRTLALSELPDQDCCTLLTPRHVETRARIDDLRRIEARLEAADLAEELAGLAQEYRPDRP
jgi:thiamine biosynthesis protein ThiI